MNLITEIDEKLWNQLVEKSKVASYFQTLACYKFYKGLSFLKPFVFAVEDNNELQALICGYIISDGGAIKSFLSRRAIVPGGILLSPECSNEAIVYLLNAVKRDLAKKAIYIELRNYYDYSSQRQVVESTGFKYEDHLNFHVLTESVEKSLAALSTTKRRDVKVSKKNGATIELASTEEEIEEYYQLLKKLYTEKVKTPLFPYEFFVKLFHEEEGKFFLVKHDGKVMGGSVCVALPNRVLYEWFVCGLDREIKNVFPSTLATWGAIEYASANNFQFFDMMGAGKPTEGYGVRDFKAKFGGELLEEGRFCYVCNSFLYSIGKLGVKILKHLK